MTDQPRPDEMFAPHPCRVRVALALTPIEHDMVRRALTHCALRRRDEGLNRLVGETVELRARMESPVGEVPFGSTPGVATESVRIFHVDGGDLRTIQYALRDYALDNGDNVHESFGDRATVVCEAAWQLGEELRSIYDRVQEVWGDD